MSLRWATARIAYQKELFCRSRAFVQSLWHPYICMWLLPNQNCNSAMLRDWERRSCRSNPLTKGVSVEMSWCSDLLCARILNFFVMTCDVFFFKSSWTHVWLLFCFPEVIAASHGKIHVPWPETSGRGWVIELHIRSFLKIWDPQVAPPSQYGIGVWYYMIIHIEELTWMIWGFHDFETSMSPICCFVPQDEV